MNTKLYRIIALVAAAAMLLLFTGCLMPQQQPTAKVEIEESKSTMHEYAARKLIFKPANKSAVVNYDTVLGYFCYEDNEERILTEDTKSDKADDSIQLSVKVIKDDGSVASPDDYVCEIYKNEKSGANGYVHINSKVIGRVEISAVAANGSRADVPEIAIAKRSVGIFDILLCAIGLYLLFAGIVGKGKLYDSEFVKEGMEQKRRTIIRVTCLVVGILMVASFLIKLLDGYGEYGILSTIIFFVMLAVFIVALLLLRGCTDQKAKYEAQSSPMGARRKQATSAAFEFDESEPTLDDITKNNKRTE